MPTLTATTVEGDRATFVEVVLWADRPHRVRLGLRFDGPVWPPRTNGTVEKGWGRDGLITEIGAGRTAIGFATSARPDGDPVELVRSKPIPDGLPAGIAAWVDRVEGRLETAERLGNADDLPTATEAIASVGGLSAVERLAAEIARDRRLAARLSVVPDDVRERLEAVEIPASTFARIASGTSGWDSDADTGPPSGSSPL
ncbi:hypothetical protein [Natronomonas sp. LN261]|uniref:DUF7857 domain-containing protein n=1 Tax=Natronomonas sp. LN261 TaxID=2750669 RepID=UPI0015EF106D|nr:hypothetical protein [Natronomonas sp. LN261]